MALVQQLMGPPPPPARSASERERDEAASMALAQQLMEEERMAQREREAAVTFTCAVCFCDEAVQGSFTGECDHRICADCFTDHVKTTLDGGNIGENSLCCIADGCGVAYAAVAIEQFLRNNAQEELSAKFMELRTEEALRADAAHFRKCPYEGCNHFFAWSVGDPKDFTCPACTNAFCLLCTADGGAPAVRPAHPGQTCEQRREAIQANETARKEALERKLIDARKEIEDILDVSCPRCNTRFAGFTGCAALYCSNQACKAGFCALCFADCGSNAHNHVTKCPLRGDHFRGTYHLKEPEDQTWQRALKPGRRTKLEQRWQLLDEDTRRRLSADDFIKTTLGEYDLQGLLAQDAPEDYLAP